jgi:hypothetical protein
MGCGAWRSVFLARVPFLHSIVIEDLPAMGKILRIVGIVWLIISVAS